MKKKFYIEIAAVVLSVIAVIAVLDSRRVFAYDESNNHVGRRWTALYRLSRKQPVDVFVLGNSHAYTGLLPKELSCALGKTCFVLASQGNYLTDAYYMLKEALEVTKPKLVVVETYLIRNYTQKDFKGGDLTCQIQSFEARRNVWQKLQSTFSLFSIDNAPYAWSGTLRNHSYVFDNVKQLKHNLKHPEAPRMGGGLYLGRFVRFTSGLERKVLARYAEEGAPVDGKDMTVSEDAYGAMEDIVSLCKKKGVDIMFLTLPMYKDHVCNYDVWRSNLSRLIGRYDYPWLDMQYDYDHEMFGPECFENTYASNQHMTFTGAQVCTYKLADYIRMHYPQLIQSGPSEGWKELFYGEDGYFENFSPEKSERRVLVIGRHADVGGVHVNEVLVASYPKYNQIIVKTAHGGHTPESIHAFGEFRTRDGKDVVYKLDLPRQTYFIRPDYDLYTIKLDKGLVLKDFRFHVPE